MIDTMKEYIDNLQRFHIHNKEQSTEDCQKQYQNNPTEKCYSIPEKKELLAVKEQAMLDDTMQSGHKKAV